MRRLVLASASPARLSLLRTAGLDPEVVVSDVDEEQAVTEASRAMGVLSPVQVADVLARAKAASVAGGVAPGTATTVDAAPLVVGCDSVLEFEGAIFGKPGTAERARERWRLLRGRTGVLHTGHHVVDTGTGRVASGVGSTTVHFASVSNAEIDAYVATGEPLHVAGAFTLDGRGAPFISRIEGDPSNVVGLSLPLLRTLLRELGVGWFDLGPAPVG